MTFCPPQGIPSGGEQAAAFVSNKQTSPGSWATDWPQGPPPSTWRVSEWTRPAFRSSPPPAPAAKPVPRANRHVRTRVCLCLTGVLAALVLLIALVLIVTLALPARHSNTTTGLCESPMAPIQGMPAVRNMIG